MKRPWQVWLLFALGVGLVVPPMAWLTVKALELDRAELQARQKIELEEHVSRALWRMDVLLMPLLAQEAARPAQVYCPTVTTLEGEGKSRGNPRQTASPLLIAPPDYVLVHFEIAPDGSISSPQCPPGKDAAWAGANGVPYGLIEDSRRRLDQLALSLDRDAVLALLPDENLPPLFVSGIPWNTFAGNNNRSQIVANTFDQTQALNPEPAAPELRDSILPNAPAQPVQQSTNSEFAGQPPENYSQPNPQAQSRLFTSNSANSRGSPRLDNDLQSRGQAYQAIAQRAYQQQRENYSNLDIPTGEPALEGVSQPLWIGNRLILARRIKSASQTLIQGCWLDWDRLQVRLREEIVDLNLPDVRFVPLTNVSAADQNHLLATVPVQLEVGTLLAEPAWDSPIRGSLIVAWTFLVVAALFAAVTLRGVVTLSERRGAFVSAVTHELRTPLTTFRMYAEMLAEGMVPTAEQRQKYLDTLRREADRLAHLVENVLQYARLERGNPARHRETLTLEALLSRVVPPLSDRAQQAEMKLVIEADDQVQDTQLSTDGGAVEQILFNLVDNACKYAAAAQDKRIHLNVSVEPREVLIRVCDHGPGIARVARRKLFRPFSKSVQEAARTAPGVGLGLALSKRLAHDLGGRLAMAPADAEPLGAVFVLSLPRR